jgi:succinyl-CoA synthetase beta subunit
VRLYEHEAKSILKNRGIPVPEGHLLLTTDELKKLSYPVILKGQTLVGRRGKAGLIQPANSADEAETKVSDILAGKIDNYRVQGVLVEEKVQVAKEHYVAATIDRVRHRPLLITSSAGGMEIEEIAEAHPQTIHRRYFEPGEKIDPYVGREVASLIGLRGAELVEAASVICKIYSTFLTYDCKLLEINPLPSTSESHFLALDVKMDLDEDAMYRHPELKELGIEPRHEVGELNEREKIAKQAGIPYVELDGDVGTFPGGAGFGIAVLDLISDFGGQPANFMDSGGAPSQERLRLMIGLLMDNPKVKAVFGARFGGISRCDDWAKALVEYVTENRPKKPMVMRMVGNMEEEGRKIFEAARAANPELFQKIKVYKYDTPIEEVVKEAIRAAKEA